MSERLLSLDAFRGFTVACMIMVNNPGSWSHIYPPLEHASWNGLTPTDLVFPFFLFMVGVSVVFSLKKHLDTGSPKSKLCSRIIFRALKIYAVAILLLLTMRYLRGNTVFTDISQIRLVGVLPRIAAVYLVCGLLYLYTGRKTQIVLCTVFLVGYCLCMTLIPTPGHGGKVLLEPGRNFAAFVDSKVVPGRMYRNPDMEKPEDKGMLPWDPEGAFSTIPAVASGLLGIFAGTILMSNQTQERKVIWLFFGGALLAVGGYFWSLSFPVNKSLWTSSYVLLTSGFAWTILAASIFFVDMLGQKKFASIGIVFGCNAIFIFVLSALISVVFYGKGGWNQQAMQWMVAHGTSREFASLAYALFFVGVNFIPAWILYKLKIYIRL